MHAVFFTPAARMDLIEAQDWYENELPGLGRRFLAALDEVVDRVSDRPHQFPVVPREIRRALFRTFPYALMFLVNGDEIVTVIACFHASRDPRKWQEL